jgi:membrane protein implicated in regulation of membrane protease activity
MLSYWILWAIATMILIISEIFVPGFWISIFSFGTLFASISAGIYPDNLKLQLIVFSIFSTLGFFVIRPFVFKYIYKNSDSLETNIDAMIGKKAVVTEEINNLLSKGRVKFGGESWMARTENDEVIATDEIVEILRIEGAKVFVKHFLGE